MWFPITGSFRNVYCCAVLAGHELVSGIRNPPDTSFPIMPTRHDIASRHCVNTEEPRIAAGFEVSGSSRLIPDFRNMCDVKAHRHGTSGELFDLVEAQLHRSVTAKDGHEHGELLVVGSTSETTAAMVVNGPSVTVT